MKYLILLLVLASIFFFHYLFSAHLCHETLGRLEAWEIVCSNDDSGVL